MSQLVANESLQELSRRQRAVTGLLELIARTCDLTPEQQADIRRHYTEKIEHLKKCTWLQPYDLLLEPQGSVSYDVTVRPIERKHSEHDVDLLLTVKAHASAFRPDELHREIGNQLRLAYRDIMSPIRYGWQLDYAESERFHFDIIAAIPYMHKGQFMVAVTDWKNSDWKPSNPMGFRDGVLHAAAQLPLLSVPEEFSLREGHIPMVNAREVVVVPLPENTPMKMPLQRGIQLTKRFREVWFARRRALTRKTPSIILTTILWQAYERYVIGRTFSSILEVLQTLADHLDDSTILRLEYDVRGKLKYVLPNPTVADENLVERWNGPERAHEATEYYQWVKDYQAFVRSLAKTQGLNYLQPLLGEALGRELVDPVFRSMTEAVRSTPTRGTLGYTTALGLTSASAMAVPRHTYDGHL
ncbi:MAG: hypothetical protein JSS11_05825 [Verrucomicrobia bacterium]|nr:hypothetical protein [Verrucomicrobiota bacterium]